MSQNASFFVYRTMSVTDKVFIVFMLLIQAWKISQHLKFSCLACFQHAIAKEQTFIHVIRDSYLEHTQFFLFSMSHFPLVWCLYIYEG